MQPVDFNDSHIKRHRLVTYAVVAFVSFLALIIMFISREMSKTQTYSMRSFASESANTEADQESTAPYTPRVLYLILNPKEGNRSIAREYFKSKWNGKTLAQVEEYEAKVNIDAYKKITRGRVNYSVAKTLQINTSPKYTNGFVFTVDNYLNCRNGTILPNGLSCEEQKQLFDHNAFIADNNICGIARKNNIDEIWLLSSPYITTWENWMIGPDEGFNINGGVYVDARCPKHMAVINPTYESIAPMTHIYGHRIEATLQYISQFWNSEDREKYIERFVNLVRYSYPYNGPGEPYALSGCGNAHFPLNGLEHYDYDQPTRRLFNCTDWNNFPNLKGTTNDINCKAWNCTDEGWNMYWQKFIPHENGKVDLTMREGNKVTIKRDWWFYIVHPDNAIHFFKKSLPPITPTPTGGTATPTPTPWQPSPTPVGPTPTPPLYSPTPWVPTPTSMQPTPTPTLSQ